AYISAEPPQQLGRGTARQRRRSRRRQQYFRRQRLAVQERICNNLVEQLDKLLICSLPNPPSNSVESPCVPLLVDPAWVESSQKNQWSSACMHTQEDYKEQEGNNGERDIRK
ncbi:rev protein, partial [Simian immunodeficiency virus]